MAQSIRAAAAAAGVVALLLAAFLGAPMAPGWLIVPGVFLLVLSEGVGLGQLGVTQLRPKDRLLQGIGEALPAIGVAAFAPVAIVTTVGVVVFALLANGVGTVLTARGRPVHHAPSETMRRLFLTAANLGLLLVPLNAAYFVSVQSMLGVPTRGLVLICVTVTLLACSRTGLDLAMALRGTARQS